MKIQLYGITDVGQKRSHNEDSFAICKNIGNNEWSFDEDEMLELSVKGALMAVADGVGGANAGEVASYVAIESVKASFEELVDISQSIQGREKLLEETILKAHQDILTHQQKEPETAGMCTTLILGWVKDNHLHVGWVGDSRCYIHHEGITLLPFTNDHSLVWDFVKNEEMTPEEARIHPKSPIITQSLGNAHRLPTPDTKTATLSRGDRIILCSDGLNGIMSDRKIESIIEKQDSPVDTCKTFVHKANEFGGDDHITITVMDIVEGATPKQEVIEKRNYKWDGVGYTQS